MRQKLEHMLAGIPHIKVGAKHLWFDFDKETDVLYISFERPQRAKDTDILDDGTFLRLRGKKIVGMTITNISKKFGNANP